jgi:hypothetical protein
MTHRERFLNRINGRPVDRVPFFPDLSKWYEYNRYGDGPRKKVYAPGGLIPPQDKINKLRGIIPEQYADKNLFEIHADLDCGIPVHGYDACYKIENKNIEIITDKSENQVINVYKTPVGELREVIGIAVDYSACRKEYLLKTAEDFRIFEYILEHQEIRKDYSGALEALDIIGEQGYLNCIINRSPMGKLVHNFMGVENVTFALFDTPDLLRGFLKTLLEHDRTVWNIVADSPAEIAFMADNMDEFLISPDWYREFFLPVYQEMNEVLHRGGKKILTHMDGRLKNMLPMIKDTGFDVLDGCTPAPMTDFEPFELAAALGHGQYAYCGIPAPFLIQGYTDNQILSFTKKILDQMREKVILNIGDIMPERGDIEIIRKISEMLK